MQPIRSLPRGSVSRSRPWIDKRIAAQIAYMLAGQSAAGVAVVHQPRAGFAADNDRDMVRSDGYGPDRGVGAGEAIPGSSWPKVSAILIENVERCAASAIRMWASLWPTPNHSAAASNTATMNTTPHPNVPTRA